MNKINDKQILEDMEKDIHRYLTSFTDLGSVVQIIELGANSLESIDASWKKKILGEWVELEIVYSSILERDELNLSPTKEEESVIHDTLVAIKKILEQINDLIEVHFCPSCGADISDSSVWCTAGKANDTCNCCGLTFGRQPPSIQDVKEARERWLLHPEFWKDPKAMPDNWKMEDQISNIPEAYL